MPTSANASEPVAEPLRLTLDLDAERAQARLRFGAALIALAGATWLSLVDGRIWPRIAAVLSALLAVRMVQGYRAAQGALANAAGHYLEITADQLVIAAGDTQQRIARDELAAIELDHDRLVVVLRCHDGSEIAIEPRYGGLTFEALGQTLQAALAPRAVGGAPA
jgi:hypothetical protein